MTERIYIEPPTDCPSCNYPLHWEGEFLMCDNRVSCPAQVRGGMAKWIEALGLLDWGEGALDALMDDHGVSEPADLYEVTENTLADLMLTGRKLGRSMAQRMIQARDARKSLSLGAAVGAMGIPLCAKDTCETIVSAGYTDLEALEAATEADLVSIDGIGSSKAKSFATNFPRAKYLLDQLIEVGFEIKSGSGGLTGETVCFTGFRDADLHRAVEDAGGIMKSGVSKKLTILVADNPNGASGKLKKARGYGTKVIGIDDLRGMLGLRTNV